MHTNLKKMAIAMLSITILSVSPAVVFTDAAAGQSDNTETDFKLPQGTQNLVRKSLGAVGHRIEGRRHCFRAKGHKHCGRGGKSGGKSAGKKNNRDFQKGVIAGAIGSVLLGATGGSSGGEIVREERIRECWHEEREIRRRHRIIIKTVKVCEE